MTKVRRLHNSRHYYDDDDDDDVPNDDEEYKSEDKKEELIYSPSYISPNAKYKVALRGYTGCPPITPHEEDAIQSPNKKTMIRGYSGYLPGSRNTVGVPLIPSEEKQLSRFDGTKTDSESSSPVLRQAGHLQDHVEQSTLGSSFTNFRSYGKHMELGERYANAIYQLSKRGQTQQMLLRIVQAKLSERVSSYAQQHVRIRKIFEYFDMNGSNDLDEHEFRQFLELSNVYFDDIQSLALFAYFDQDKTGGISWESFEENAMVQNPKGGTAVIPKAITATTLSDDWKSVAKGKPTGMHKLDFKS